MEAQIPLLDRVYNVHGPMCPNDCAIGCTIHEVFDIMFGVSKAKVRAMFRGDKLEHNDWLIERVI